MSVYVIVQGKVENPALLDQVPVQRLVPRSELIRGECSPPMTNRRWSRDSWSPRVP